MSIINSCSIKTYAFLLFTLAILTGCQKDKTAPAEILDPTRSAPTVRLMENSNLVAAIYTDSTIELAPGVVQTDIHYKDMNGHSMRVFIVEADMNRQEVKIEPMTPFGSTAFARQTVPDMITYKNSSTTQVLAAVNADFLNANTGEPRSIVYLEGKAVRTSILEGWGYFGVYKDGTIGIGGPEEYVQRQSEIYNALGGHQRLVKNGEVVGIDDGTIAPRTAGGITPDNKVIFAVIDGRRYDYSNGMDYHTLGVFMKALGATDALNFDGGGSSTFVIRHPAAAVYQVKNWSSDGSPRAVANGWAIVNKK